MSKTRKYAAGGPVSSFPSSTPYSGSEWWDTLPRGVEGREGLDEFARWLNPDPQPLSPFGSDDPKPRPFSPWAPWRGDDAYTSRTPELNPDDIVMGAIARDNPMRTRNAYADGGPVSKTNPALDLARRYANGGRTGYADGGTPAADEQPFTIRSLFPSNDMLERMYTGAKDIGTSLLPPMPHWPVSKEEALDELNKPRMEDAINNALMVTPGGALAKAAKYLAVPSGLVLGGAMLDAAKAQPSEGRPARYDGPTRPRQQVEQLQKQLMDAGFNVKVDGNDGGATRDAELLWKEKRAAEDRKLRLDEETAQTRASEARTASERTAGEKTASDRAAAEREGGLKRLAEVENDPSKQPWLNPNYAYLAGYPLGALMGYGVGKVFQRGARTAMEGANSLLATAGKGKIADRAANLNAFYKQGGAEADPFVAMPGKMPPFKPNAKAPSAGDLYPAASTKPEWMTQAGGAGFWGMDSGMTGLMAHGANQEKEKAAEAMSATPNEATISRYLDARNSANNWDAATNALRAMALGQLSAAKYTTAMRPNYRPDVNKAEAERFKIDESITKKKKEVKAYGDKEAADKAAKEKQKAARAEARASKGNGKVPPGALGVAGGMMLPSPSGEEAEASLPISQELTSPFSMDDLGEEVRASGGPVKGNKPEPDHHSYFQPRDRIGKFAGGPVYPKIAATYNPRQTGGAVNALDLARQYAGQGRADGGEVTDDRWHGLKGYMPEQPEIMKSAQRAISPYIPTIMQALSAIPAGRGTASMMRDNVMAGRLERTMPFEREMLDTGRKVPVDPAITGGWPSSRGGSELYPASNAGGSDYWNSAAGLARNSGVRPSSWPTENPYYLPEVAPAAANDPSLLVIQGGKKADGGGVSAEPSALDIAREYLAAPMREAAAKPQSQLWKEFGQQALQLAPWGIASSAGAGLGRDLAMATKLENKARAASGTYDWGITGGLPNAPRTGSNFYYDPIARSSSGLGIEPGMRRAIDPYYVPEAAPRPANLNSLFEVIPGGKKAYGGAIDIARQYAQGGTVAGPIVGHDGGRADTKPVNVASGSFVVPADVVAGLGQGNTLGGMRALEKMFGKPSPQARAAGGMTQDIPIQISDGEYVVTPEQVAKIGRGSVDQGHRTLDQMVLQLRKQHIAELSKLPPPAKS